MNEVLKPLDIAIEERKTSRVLHIKEVELGEKISFESGAYGVGGALSCTLDEAQVKELMACLMIWLADKDKR